MRRENSCFGGHWDGRSYWSECSRCVLPHYPVKQKKTVEACGYTETQQQCSLQQVSKFVPHYLVFPCYCWFLFLFGRILSEFSRLFLWHILKTLTFFYCACLFVSMPTFSLVSPCGWVCVAVAVRQHHEQDEGLQKALLPFRSSHWDHWGERIHGADKSAQHQTHKG